MITEIRNSEMISKTFSINVYLMWNRDQIDSIHVIMDFYSHAVCNNHCQIRLFADNDQIDSAICLTDDVQTMIPAIIKKNSDIIFTE